MNFAYPAAPPEGNPPLISLYGVAGIVEFWGEHFNHTRSVYAARSVLAWGQMAVAYFMVHAPKGLG